MRRHLAQWFALVLLAGVLLGCARGLKVEDDDETEMESAPDVQGPPAEVDEDDELTVEDIPDETEPPSPSRSSTSRSSTRGAGRASRDKNFRADPSYFSENDLVAVEVVLAVVSLCFCVVFLVGRRQNEKLANVWRSVMAEECHGQFAQLGVDGSAALLRGGYGSYIFYATGRRYSEFVSATLNLVHRFDLFQTLIRYFVKSDPDVVTMVFALSDENSGSSGGPVTEPLIACLMLRREVKKMLEKYADLQTYTETVSSVRVPDKFTVVSNVPEIAAAVFAEGTIRSSLFTLEDTLLSVHVTTEGIPDPGSRNRKRVLCLVYKLPSSEEDIKAKSAAVMRMGLAMVDGLGRLKLSKETKDAAIRGQKKVNELEFKRREAERQEAAQNRRIEKERKRKDEVASMSREAQLKYEAQKKKKELRKQSAGGRARRVALG